MTTNERARLEDLHLPDARHSRLPRHGQGGAPIGALLGVIGGGMLALMVAVYAGLIAIAPGPAVQLTYAEESTVQFVADPSSAAAVATGQASQTAVGWLSDDDVWSNSEDPLPMASLVKLVTALVGLETRPIQEGTAGESYVWSDADIARANEIVASDGVVSGLPLGAEVSEKDLLALMLLPSASDAAYAYAVHVFGSVEAFLDAANQWADAQGLTSVTVAGPDGLDPASVVTPQDAVRIGRLALSEPSIAELTALPTYQVPGISEPIENTNSLVGQVEGVVGIKTGTLYAVGSHLLVAQRLEVAGREFTSVAAVMARPDLETRAADARAVLEQLATLPFVVTVVSSDAALATATTADGATIDLLASESAELPLVPGESAQRTVTLAKGPTDDIAEGAVLGKVDVSGAGGERTIDLVAAAPLPAPGYWWKFTHPSQAFG